MKVEKIRNQLGPETIKELEALSKAELERVIADAEQAIKQATEERDANPAYQEAKENIKALSEGLKEVKKRQQAKIQFALLLRNGDSV